MGVLSNAIRNLVLGDQLALDKLSDQAYLDEVLPNNKDGWRAVNKRNLSKQVIPKVYPSTNAKFGPNPKHRAWTRPGGPQGLRRKVIPAKRKVSAPKPAPKPVHKPAPKYTPKYIPKPHIFKNIPQPKPVPIKVIEPKPITPEEQNWIEKSLNINRNILRDPASVPDQDMIDKDYQFYLTHGFNEEQAIRLINSNKKYGKYEQDTEDVANPSKYDTSPAVYFDEEKYIQWRNYNPKGTPVPWEQFESPGLPTWDEKNSRYNITPDTTGEFTNHHNKMIEEANIPGSDVAREREAIVEEVHKRYEDGLIPYADIADVVQEKFDQQVTGSFEDNQEKYRKKELLIKALDPMSIVRSKPLAMVKPTATPSGPIGMGTGVDPSVGSGEWNNGVLTIASDQGGKGLVWKPYEQYYNRNRGKLK